MAKQIRTSVGLDGTVEHESMGTRHDNRALAARAATRIPSDHSVTIHQTDNMKLISFVAISFLAITVSAQTPPSASTEDMQQHQSTATQSAQQHQSTATRIPQQHDQDGFQLN
ncbi:hypothetical protein BASA83_011123 [Batrachochytrium salamandrivorans]|nr:hypothetical protein BASA83_011123 [Batrachochytrium salamandrivorans]